MIAILILHVGFVAYYVVRDQTKTEEISSNDSSEQNRDYSAKNIELEQKTIESPVAYTSPDLGKPKSDEGTYNSGAEVYKHTLTLNTITYSVEEESLNFEIDWENQGSESFTYSASDCKLSTASKQVKNATTAATSSDKFWHSTELLPEGKITTTIGYPVGTDDAKSGTLTCRPEGVWGSVSFDFNEIL